MSGETVIKSINLKKYFFIFEKDYQIIPWIVRKNKEVKTRKVLDDLSFEIKRGETVGIIGKNGAGKSTLMKLIAGITFPTSGEILVDGSVGSLINLRAGFDNESTGRENIYNKATMMGMSAEHIGEIIDDVIDFADIGEYIDLPLKTYSSGMAARLGFSLAVFSDPDVLIIDEVMAVGDKDFKNKSLAKTKEMFNSGKTIIFASHSEKMIKDFCHRVMYLKDGKIVFDGDVDEGLKKYNGK